jgi:dTDP-4-amino-4,6-dideoxygalactose transaminase
MHVEPHDENPTAAPVQLVSTWPICGEDEREAADRVLRSGKLNYWTGEEGRRFEREFADVVQCNYAVAVANGTVALELALWSLGIGPGHEVVVPSRTFIATASSVVRCGAVPVFADVDRQSQNITADSIRECLSARTKAIIVVHLAGWPCEMDAIVDLARKHGLTVVEDCAQATGARYKGRPVGSIGDVGAFSFCQDKIMTTAGEGGMLVTNRRDVWQNAWSLKDHGKNYESASAHHAGGGFRWLHDRIGTNWRLTEVQSAIGRVALGKLDGWVATRRRNAAILNEAFADCAVLRTACPPPHLTHAYYKYYAFVRPEQIAPDWNRDRLLGEIRSAGVTCYAGTCSEVYLEEALDLKLRPRERHPVARELGETSLMLLVDPTLSESSMREAAATVSTIVPRAQRHRHEPSIDSPHECGDSAALSPAA